MMMMIQMMHRDAGGLQQCIAKHTSSVQCGVLHWLRRAGSGSVVCGGGRSGGGKTRLGLYSVADIYHLFVSIFIYIYIYIYIYIHLVTGFASAADP